MMLKNKSFVQAAVQAEKKPPPTLRRTMVRPPSGAEPEGEVEEKNYFRKPRLSLRKMPFSHPVTKSLVEKTFSEEELAEMAFPIKHRLSMRRMVNAVPVQIPEDADTLPKTNIPPPPPPLTMAHAETNSNTGQNRFQPKESVPMKPAPISALNPAGKPPPAPPSFAKPSEIPSGTQPIRPPTTPAFPKPPTLPSGPKPVTTPQSKPASFRNPGQPFPPMSQPQSPARYLEQTQPSKPIGSSQSMKSRIEALNGKNLFGNGVMPVMGPNLFPPRPNLDLSLNSSRNPLINPSPPMKPATLSAYRAY